MIRYGHSPAGPVPGTPVPPALAALLAPDGQALLAELRDCEVTPQEALALGTRLRQHYPADLVASALAQQELRLSARAKFPRAMDMYFTRDGLEQASSELVAAHRARRLAAALGGTGDGPGTGAGERGPAGAHGPRDPAAADGGESEAGGDADWDGSGAGRRGGPSGAGDHGGNGGADWAGGAHGAGWAGSPGGTGVVADLCCGIGGDLTALAAAGVDVLAVDRDPLHLAMAGANAAALGLAGQVQAWIGDVRDAPLDGCAAVFIDPARRDRGRRMAPGASEPPLDWCLALAGRVPMVAIKAAPGLAREDVPDGWETEFIAVGRDLKEAVLWSPALAGAAARATILPGGDQLTPLPAGAAPPPGARPPGEFLLDPSPAVTRAGLVRDLAALTGGWQIDEQIAFLSADRPLVSPFGRSLRVLDSGPWNQKQLPARLRAAGAGSVDIRRRGLAGNVEILHRQLARQLDPAATRRTTLVMTRAAGRPWALICEDLEPS